MNVIHYYLTLLNHTSQIFIFNGSNFEYCWYTWNGPEQLPLSILDKIQKVFTQPCRRWIIFYSFPEKTHSPKKENVAISVTNLIGFSFICSWNPHLNSHRVPLVRRKYDSERFFPRGPNLWNKLPKWWFPKHYNINVFKSSVNCNLLFVFLQSAYISFTLLRPWNKFPTWMDLVG